MNIAIVGCGAQAKQHVRVLKAMNAFNLVALCDVDKRALAIASDEWNLPHTYTNFDEMLEREKLDLISILTPPQTHVQLAIGAVDRGISLLVEKPLTLLASEAELILKHLENSSAKLTVNYNGLFSKTMLKALSLVRSGGIGDVLGMRVEFLNPKDDPMTSDRNHWCHKNFGGRFGEMLAHPVYLLQSILGNNLTVANVIAEKRGSYDWMAHDELHVTLRGEAGPGEIYASFNSPRPAYLVDIFGTERILKIDLTNQTLIALGQRTLKKTDAAFDCLHVSRELFLYTIRNSLEYVLLGRGDGSLQEAYSSLVHSVGTGDPPLVTPNMAYHTVKTVEEICKQIDPAGMIHWRRTPS